MQNFLYAHTLVIPSVIFMLKTRGIYPLIMDGTTSKNHKIKSPWFFQVPYLDTIHYHKFSCNFYINIMHGCIFSSLFCISHCVHSVPKRTCASTEYANHLRINQHQDTVLHSMVVVMLLFTLCFNKKRINCCCCSSSSNSSSQSSTRQLVDREE